MLDHHILLAILVRRGADSPENWGPSGLLGSFSDLTKFRGFPSRALNYGFGVFLRLLAPISVPCFRSCWLRVFKMVRRSAFCSWRRGGTRGGRGRRGGTLGGRGRRGGTRGGRGRRGGTRGSRGRRGGVSAAAPKAPPLLLKLALVSFFYTSLW